jgi:hypothetical protein
MAASLVSAATPTGGASGSSWSKIVWEDSECNQTGCYAYGDSWSGTSDGQNYWTTTYEHSEGTTSWLVAPFEQDVDLQNGTQLWGMGVWPIAGTDSTIYYANGSLYYSGFEGTRGQCYATISNPAWIYWGLCSSGGFTMNTATYPPGTTVAYYIISPNDSNIAGGWSDTYSGSLR